MLLEREPLAVEGLLAEVGGPRVEVGVGLFRGEVEQLEAVRGDVAGDLGQVLADAAHGAVGRRPAGSARQGLELDQAADGGPGLPVGGRELAELRHRGQW